MSLLQLELWQLAVVFSPLLIVFWSLWHISVRTFPTFQERYYWILFCSFVPVIGTLIYIIFGIRRSSKTVSKKPF